MVHFVHSLDQHRPGLAAARRGRSGSRFLKERLGGCFRRHLLSHPARLFEYQPCVRFDGRWSRDLHHRFHRSGGFDPRSRLATSHQPQLGSRQPGVPTVSACTWHPSGQRSHRYGTELAWDLPLAQENSNHGDQHIWWTGCKPYHRRPVSDPVRDDASRTGAYHATAG